ncbi:hypothetical protein [Oxalicibacterium flavum]|uniref:hypothetical protein n=1 Tax=Oxalicibacterium flavum TaxID=179467 RepID=UPI001663E9EA|nr:hypothetical protein [Oxalicibacterium flavum]
MHLILPSFFHARTGYDRTFATTLPLRKRIVRMVPSAPNEKPASAGFSSCDFGESENKIDEHQDKGGNAEQPRNKVFTHLDSP